MKNLKRNIGYTIDQTILIVAIIAILITLVIATVGWDIITRAGGTKFAAQLKQVEDAVGQFYAEHQLWPHQATTLTNRMNIVPRVIANTGTGYTLVSNVDETKMRNYVSGFEYDGTELRHAFGAGGRIQIVANTAPTASGVGSNLYTLVQFSDVPINEAEEADESIDGIVDSVLGRVFYRPEGSQCLVNNSFAAAPGGSAIPDGTATVNVCYLANLVQ